MYLEMCRRVACERMILLSICKLADPLGMYQTRTLSAQALVLMFDKVVIREPVFQPMPQAT